MGRRTHSPLTNHGSTMSRFAVLLILVLCAPASLRAQAEEDQVMTVINRVFDAMRAGDSAMARTAFDSTARLMTAMPDGLRLGSLNAFLNAVGSPHDAVWDEPIWDWEVQIDGPLAQVWTKYAFYLGDRFSHCGVDAFQLYRRPEGWKIIQLIDTRRQEGCEMPPGR